MAPDKTTVEVTHEVWAAMDKRKDEDETFDAFIRRLINNTPIPMGNLEGMETAPTVDLGEIERVEGPHDEETKSCAHFDAIGGTCENSVEWRQEYFMPGDDEPHYFYYCDEHKPESRT